MAAVAYEDEETQDQIPHSDPNASDYNPNSESETDSEEHIVSLASTPIPSARSGQFPLSKFASSQAGPSVFCSNTRACTPRPSKQVIQVSLETQVNQVHEVAKWSYRHCAHNVQPVGTHVGVPVVGVCIGMASS